MNYEGNNKYYINVADYQGGSWGMGHISTIAEWQQYALEWCDSDENWEMYDYIKNHALDKELLDIISDYWSIKIVEFSRDNYNLIEERYDADSYRYLIGDILSKIKNGEIKLVGC